MFLKTYDGPLILEAGKSRKKDLLFVSGEEKSDWFHKSERQTLYPRYELVDEYRRSSEGQSFHIASFAQFLNIYGASESIVKEVRDEERKLNLEFSALGEFVRKWVEFERAVHEKCKEANPQDPTLSHASMEKMLQVLNKYEVISENFYNRARGLTDIRNSTVHGHTTFSSEALRNAIDSLDDLMDEL